ncbi:MAG: Fe(2+)-trafficking protein [Phycisphaerales bacterium]|nr:Fe(2+)-trafficking protein [Phycisphaerales bacterium]
MTTDAINARIAQFETMVAPGADPTNDMAWFSLGQAYSQAGRHGDAARAFTRCFEINGDMTKAYQLAGAALVAAGDKVRAVEVLKAGYEAAAKRGDFMPKKAMGELLQQLGVEPPQVAGAKAEVPVPTGAFVDRKTGRPGTKLDRPPFRGPVGEWIAANISRETWQAWIAQGTKVINELRLDLSRDDHSAMYDQHMREYLGIDEELHAQLTGQKA